MDNSIKITGARAKNLKDINVEIPRGAVTVISGPAGSGKTSLAFDVIYNEGQRVYLESLSTYARQFFKLYSKADVDKISGLSPTLGAGRPAPNRNPRSTVGSITGVYRQLRLLFCQLGVPHCAVCGRVLHACSADEITEKIIGEFQGSLVEIIAPFKNVDRQKGEELSAGLLRDGYRRARYGGKTFDLENGLPKIKAKTGDYGCIADRLTVRAENHSRLAEAVENALNVSGGFADVLTSDGAAVSYSSELICPQCRVAMPEISPAFFSFNTTEGACPQCGGLGLTMSPDPEAAINWELPLADGGFPFWRGNKHTIPKAYLLAQAHGWDLSKPLKDLSREAIETLVYGTDEKIPWIHRGGRIDPSKSGEYEGLLPWMKRKVVQTESESLRRKLLECCSMQTCPTCLGKRLRAEALAVTIEGRSIIDFMEMTITELAERLRNISWEENRRRIAAPLTAEILTDLDLLDSLGVGYIALSRLSAALSAGELERVYLAPHVRAKLSDVIYVLDDPFGGLHRRDAEKVARRLTQLKDDGGTVVVVSNERAAAEAADHVIELGPGAGAAGGRVTACGAPEDAGPSASRLRFERRAQSDGGGCGLIRVKAAEKNNLKRVDVDIPLGRLAVICGVSGSGKSSLLRDVLYRGLTRAMTGKVRNSYQEYGSFAVTGELPPQVIYMDQTPLARSGKSNAAALSGLLPAIKQFYASLPQAKASGLKAETFGPDSKDGRCPKCGGEGVIKTPMIFLPDVCQTCGACGGSGYKPQILEVAYDGISIAEMFGMTVSDALQSFRGVPQLRDRLRLLCEYGLGHIKVGQPSPTLSDGELQLIKLMQKLSGARTPNAIYLLDAPCRGFSGGDTMKVIRRLRDLVDKGASVIAAAHNPEIIAAADCVIELGPVGGPHGGYVIASGTPQVIAESDTPTGEILMKAMCLQS